MSYSLPILSTKVGGIPEIISQENGLLVTPGSEEELWLGLKYFISLSQEELYSLGKASLIKVRPFLPNQVHKKLNELYNSLLTESQCRL